MRRRSRATCPRRSGAAGSSRRGPSRWPRRVATPRPTRSCARPSDRADAVTAPFGSPSRSARHPVPEADAVRASRARCNADRPRRRRHEVASQGRLSADDQPLPGPGATRQAAHTPSRDRSRGHHGPGPVRRPRGRRLVGAGVALATYASVSNGLPPPTALEDDRAARAVDRVRPHRKVELARFGEFNREVVDVRRDPAGAHRRHHGRRGRLVLGQRGLRHRSASWPPASTPSAARRAAPRRSPSSSSASACSRRDGTAGHRPLGDPQAAGDHPVDPRHRGLPGASRASSGSSPPTSTRTTTATSPTASPPPRRATSACALET